MDDIENNHDTNERLLTDQEDKEDIVNNSLIKVESSKYMEIMNGNIHFNNVNNYLTFDIKSNSTVAIVGNYHNIPLFIKKLQDFIGSISIDNIKMKEYDQ